MVGHQHQRLEPRDGPDNRVPQDPRLAPGGEQRIAFVACGNEVLHAATCVLGMLVVHVSLMCISKMEEMAVAPVDLPKPVTPIGRARGARGWGTGVGACCTALAPAI